MKTLTLTIELLKKYAELLVKALKKSESEPAKEKEEKNEDGSREICLFCGKSHDQMPLECQIKGAGMSALWSVLDRVEAMQIADRTAFLSELTTNMMKIIPQSDSLKHSKALEIMSRLYGFKDYHQAEIELTKSVYDITDDEEKTVCDQCGNPAGYMESPEGQTCAICGEWICDGCTDYVKMRKLNEKTGKECNMPLCKKCAKNKKCIREYLKV